MKGFEPDLSPAAMASNWRQVLLVDALMGVAVVAAGIVLSMIWWRIGGWVLATFGVLYVFAVTRRYQVFKARRIEEGLDV